MGNQVSSRQELVQHPLVGIVALTLVTVGGVIWSETIISFLANRLFGKHRSQLTHIEWLTMAVLVTTGTFIILRYVLGIRLAVAYRL